MKRSQEATRPQRKKVIKAHKGNKYELIDNKKNSPTKQKSNIFSMQKNYIKTL